MIDTIRSVFRHFRPSDLGAILALNLLCMVPFAVALVGPVMLKSDTALGLVVLLCGFGVTGQALALSGRVLDQRFRKSPKQPGQLVKALSEGWAEGLVLSGVLLALFSLLFQSVPFYWEQRSLFSSFSLLTLALGTVLVLGLLPYFLPARRRERLSLFKALGRSFQLMNSQPLLALFGLAFGLLSVVATAGSFGLFPGFTGLAALHQGLWDHALEKENLTPE